MRRKSLRLHAGLAALLIAIYSCKNVADYRNLEYKTYVPTETSSQQNLKKPGKLGIYYGWPSLINGAQGNVEKAEEEFSELEYLVLGAGLEKKKHGDHEKTRQIINFLKKSGTEVYGYIDLGNDYHTSRFSLLEIRNRVAQWNAMGVSGIFYDDAYPGFGVNKNRLRKAVGYVREKKLKMIVNSSDILWAIGINVIGKASEGHSFLIEPFFISKGKYLPSEITAEIDLMVKYFISKGYAFHGVGHYDNEITAPKKNEQLKAIYEKASMLNLLSVAFTHENYAGSGMETNILNHF